MQLVVGRIGRPHGIRGEVSVDVRTDDPERRFAPGAVLETEPPDAGPLTVVRARPHAGRMLVAFAELTDRDSAESRRGTLLVADSSTSPPPEDPEEFWDHDLVGLAALATTGEQLGAVVEVLHLPGQDVLVVRSEEAAEGAEMLVPFVSAIVPEIDLRRGHVVIDPPEGLVEPVADDTPD